MISFLLLSAKSVKWRKRLHIKYFKGPVVIKKKAVDSFEDISS